MHNFRKLDVWHLSRRLGTDVYLLCATISRPEAKVITAQLRRSALSISANIAEGCGKNSRAETIRYLDIAGASAAETEHHLIQAMEVGIVETTVGESLLERATSARRMLRVLIERLPE